MQVFLFVFLFLLRYVFADVSNRTSEVPYSSFLESLAPPRLQPGPGVVPPHPYRARGGPRWAGLGWRWGCPRPALPSVPSEGHSQHPLFKRVRLARKPLLVFPVPNTTGLQLERQEIQKSSKRGAGSRKYTPSSSPPPPRLA